jgi:hypothetical protein
MKCSGKILKIILLVVIISSSFCQSVMAQTQPEPASGDTPPEVQEPIEEHDLKPEIGKIDQAGNKVGETIEAFGAKASDRLGGWIGSKVDCRHQLAQAALLPAAGLSCGDRRAGGPHC